MTYKLGLVLGLVATSAIGGVVIGYGFRHLEDYSLADHAKVIQADVNLDGHADLIVHRSIGADITLVYNPKTGKYVNMASYTFPEVEKLKERMDELYKLQDQIPHKKEDVRKTIDDFLEGIQIRIKNAVRENGQ